MATTASTGSPASSETLNRQNLEQSDSGTKEKEKNPTIGNNEPLDFQALERENHQATTALLAHQADLYRASLRGKVSQPVNRRVVDEIKLWMKDYKPNGWYTIAALPDSDLSEFLGTFRGPVGTPYEGGIFHIRIQITDRYPFTPPSAWFITKILHPSVDMRGAVSMDMLTTQWSPALTLEKVLISVASLLDTPCWTDPVKDMIPMVYAKGELEFESWARKWTLKYATGQIIHAEETDDGVSTVFVATSSKPAREILEEDAELREEFINNDVIARLYDNA